MKTSIALAIALAMTLPSGLVLAQSTAAQAPISPSAQVPASATANASFSEAQLDSLLAPVALYPDTLLSHVLIASTYPLEVVQADRWVRANPGINGEDAVNAVTDQDWDPSVKALVAFPDLLRRMSEDLDWTQQLGDAFLADEGRVMDHVQLLRNKAYAAGNLANMEHVKVVREERIITIEPSIERVVYVPAYDTRVVYGDWWWAGYPPVYWYYPSSYVYVSGFYWSAGIYLGSSFYYSGCRWHDRRVVVVDRSYRPRYYSNRYIANYRDARPWNHNPVHRRGVAYYDRPTTQRYHSSRESYRDSHDYRTSSNPHIQPNVARDQRQGRLIANPHQLVGQSTNKPRQISSGGDQPRQNNYSRPRESGNPSDSVRRQTTAPSQASTIRSHAGTIRSQERTLSTQETSVRSSSGDNKPANGQVRQPVMSGNQTVVNRQLPRITNSTSGSGNNQESARQNTRQTERTNTTTTQRQYSAPERREAQPQTRYEPRQERSDQRDSGRFTRPEGSGNSGGSRVRGDDRR